MILRRTSSISKRLFSNQNALQPLNERSLLEVNGPDASEFLQGLITNDIHHISNSVGSMFAMFLNLKGRILYDTIVYKTDKKDSYWLECDSAVSSALQKHLKIYKVRRKVNISSLGNHKIHALFSLNSDHQQNVNILTGSYDTNAFPGTSTDIKTHKDLLIFKDPRVSQLGFRIISSSNNVSNTIKDIIDCDINSSYKKIRYNLGIGEGISDLLAGSSFPLECNGDFLHGISFHKGCYIGQELTARTYHTGVIRKRLMPLLFTKVPSSLPENNSIIHDGVNLGKLRGIEGDVGIALLRIDKALKFGNISVGDGGAKVIKPHWWPIELPKEKQETTHASI
ncbi:putative transferase CAF17 homolog, mitochondrial [Sitophilus oryzae]|uniref:Transferase CAF17 homolog, mitochondrial n=1 Tax=Sitophilus oryzae TaxID=7048 RepID=A0A6J2YSD5_SITOR|nr:putative transferase CAF17 homolog, mitochondrial [Sitophilus oryzae]XP_030765700.1 putative transferase CAF17 homolog, mitochondrial [Sitophilus oryzae]XP_030765701.1 putative transferase CAF17 homolog, mitochondrial [Sitophilus oryzae]